LHIIHPLVSYTCTQFSFLLDPRDQKFQYQSWRHFITNTFSPTASSEPGETKPLHTAMDALKYVSKLQN
jgi:NAD(P)-dependent dehydrogenase (short-subunit alcohol dehydrogenase family)